MKKKNGFTLIELLAVIIILGILMIIAIPSVTNYISDSRKEAYVKTAKQVVSGTRNIVNEGKLGMYDTNTTYYIPNSCIRVENGEVAKSPYGEFSKAYVVVTYDGKGYTYYWTSLDETGIGVKNIISIDELDINNIESDLKEEDIIVGLRVDGKEKSLVLNENSCNTFSEVNPSIDSFYNTMANGSISGNLIVEYTGPHQDSITQQGTEKIYYFDTTNNEQIKNKGNIIFGGFCWQMIRTTDTGGIKILYNGMPDLEGKCSDERANNSADYEFIGKSQFANIDGLTAVGYMYNNSIINSRHTFSKEFNATLIKNTMECQYFSDKIEIVNVNGHAEFKLVDPWYDYSFSNDGVIGLYSLCNRDDGASGTKSAQKAYYIYDNKYSNVFVLRMKEGSISETVEDIYYIGSDISGPDNSGNYVISNYVTTTERGWRSTYSTGNYKNKYICINSNTCNNPIYIISTEYTKYTGIDMVEENLVYGSSVSINSEGKYVLEDPIYSWYPTHNHHYTCYSKQNICDRAYYVFYLDSQYTSYVDITGKANIDEFLSANLNSNNMNKDDSNIKILIDNWYENNLIQYSDYLEDVIFCNNRKYTLSGSWASTNNISRSNLFSFDKGFTCTNETDKFSVSNPVAKLKYPIGLPTYAEVQMMGYNVINDYSHKFYTMTPHSLTSYSTRPYIITNYNYSSIFDVVGVRPMVSLKKGIGFVKGDGSMNNPYVVG